MENKSLAYKIGQALALVFMGCIATCLAAIIISLTISLIQLIF